MTQSEAARHARAELETIAAGLRLHELARLVDLGRRLLEQDSEKSGASGPRIPLYKNMRREWGLVDRTGRDD